MLSLSIDTKAAQGRIDELAQSSQTALADSLNELAKDTLKNMRVAMAQEINLAPDYIRRHTRICRKATARNPRVILEARSRASLLNRYVTRWEQQSAKKGGMKGAGASVQVWRDTPPIHMRGAFKVLLKNGAQGLALNAKNPALPAHKKAQIGNKGYAVLHGPSVNDAFERVKAEHAPTQSELIDRFMAQLGL